MPRGFHFAVEETRIARKAGKIHSPSFIGFKPDKPNEFHELLENSKDIAKRRQEIFNLAEGMCQLCPVAHYVSEEEGHWDHIKGGQSDRCDCLANGRWACARAHELKHNRFPKWTRRAAA